MDEKRTQQTDDNENVIDSRNKINIRTKQQKLTAMFAIQLEIGSNGDYHLWLQ